MLSPLILLLIFLAACAEWELPAYGAISYPGWAHTIGWVLTLLSVLQIPAWLIISCLVSGSALSPTQAWRDRRGDTRHETFICKPSPDQSSSIIRDSYSPYSARKQRIPLGVHPACMTSPPGYDQAVSYTYFCED